MAAVSLLAAVSASASRPEDAPSSARIVEFPDWGVAFAEWDAAGQHGQERRVAVSGDGGTSWAPSEAMRYEIPLRAGTLVPGVVAPPLPGTFRADASDRLFIVQLRTKGLSAWQRALGAMGVEMLAYLPDHAWIVRMDPALAAEVVSQPFVRWVGPYHPGYKIDPEVMAAIADARASFLPQRYHLATFATGLSEKTILAREVRDVGGEVVLLAPGGYLLDALLTHGQIIELARSPHLAWLDRFSAPENDMDLVRQQDGADYVESVAGYSGQGVRGEVMDCGIMAAHQDHDGKIVHGPAASSCDHGTCTYGIVFGNGARDGDGDAKATGNLPSAQGYFYDYDNLTDRHQETSELVQAPINAVFQSNSWGDALTTSYTSVSQDMDDIIWQYDIAIFQSQSNNGSRFSRPQAWAKNIISIGAINHYDTPTLADDCWCGGASIGPAEDGRIKPDLAFWYDDIYTTDLEPGGYSAGLYTPTFGGTSAATPITAGIGGLFFQMWAANILGNNPAGTTVFEKRPHAATLKALMINTAEQYPFTGTGSDLTRVHQGWGLPSARNFYDGRAKIKVVDETNVLKELYVHTYTATVASGEPFLKITMAYTDRAGTTSSTLHRINDVSLKVTDPTGSTIYYGNVGLDGGNWSVPGGSANHIDTVENVFVQNPVAGPWTLEVSADDINMDEHQETPEIDQDYALVASGATDLSFGCAVPPAPPSGLSAAPNGDNRIDLAWSGTATARGYKVYRSSAGCGGTFAFLASLPAGQTAWSDGNASGGLTYAYQVKSVEACESAPSNCASALAQGPCILTPSFAGVVSATSNDAASCGISLTWSAGTPSCGGPIAYNVYRGTSPGFIPGPSNRVASCVLGTGLVDSRNLVANTTYSYVVRAEDTAGRGGATCNGAPESNSVVRSATVQGVQGVLVDNTFEAGADGWTFTKGTPAASAGDWLAGTPTASSSGGQPAQPGTCASGTRCLFTMINTGGNAKNGDVDGGEVVATSSVFDAGSFGTAKLTLSRWHFNDATSSDTGDHFAIDVSNNNGSSWTNVETLGPLTSVNAWTTVAYDLETKTALSSQMKLRVRSADGAAVDSIVESAVDQVHVQGAHLCATLASAAPGGIGASSLNVGKEGSKIRVSWGDDCGGASGYGIYRGDLFAGYSSAAPLPGYCGVGGTSASLDSGPDSYFFLVAPNDGSVEGSLGRIGDGTARPQPAAACWPRAATVNACSP